MVMKPTDQFTGARGMSCSEFGVSSQWPARNASEGKIDFYIEGRKMWSPGGALPQRSTISLTAIWG
jgi:hypothetical protein